MIEHPTAGALVSGGPTSGTLRRANDIADVTALMQRSDLDATILLVDSPSATAVVPLLPRVRGVVCRSGGSTSHLALVSREFGITCVMGAELPADAGQGEAVEVDASGTITLS
ncbi:MAG: PEP-utilizing enzyme [Solirubrobacteraceae bacterium]